MRYFSSFLLILLVILCKSFSYAQELGNPFVQFYLAKEYKAATQNWCLIQDQAGIMYFGNGEGVVEFDGVNWRLIPVTNKYLVRSLAIDSKGVIYVGGSNEFGYLKPNIKGKLEYESLSKLLSKEEIDFSNIWYTVVTKEGIFFQSSTKIFRWANNKLYIWKAKKGFSYMNYVNNKLLLRKIDDLLIHQIIGDSLVPMTDLNQEYSKEKESQDPITRILPYDNDKFLIHSTKKSFQIYAPNTDKLFKKLPTEIDSLIAQNGGIYHVIRQSNDTYVVIIRKVGTVIMNKNGKILQKLQKINGLHTESHYQVSNDKQGGLWIGANNGMMRVEANAPITIFKDKKGLDGTIYSIKKHEGILYVGTNLGLYYLDTATNSFKTVEGVTAQVWELKSFKVANENKLLMIGGGLFEIKNFKAIPIKPITGYTILPSVFNPQRIYVSGKGFISSLLYRNGNWEEEGTIIKKLETFRSLLEDKEGNLWASSYFDGVRKITPNNVNKTIDSTAKITRYDTLQGITLNENIFFVVNGKMLVGTEKGINQFDEASFTTVHN